MKPYPTGTGAVNDTPILGGRPLVDDDAYRCIGRGRTHTPTPSPVGPGDVEAPAGAVGLEAADTTYDLAPERVAAPRRDSPEAAASTAARAHLLAPDHSDHGEGPLLRSAPRSFARGALCFTCDGRGCELCHRGVRP